MDRFERDWTYYMKDLCQEVCIDHRQFSKLVSVLHSTPFTPKIKKDRNRVSDAICMRNRWCRDNDIVFDLPDNEICDGTCSVLELLVSFASRIDMEYTSTTREDHPEIMFWHFLENLELNNQANCNFDEFKVEKILKRFIDGKINKNGHHGLFPLVYHKDVDQRGKELWDQMMPYIGENFFGRR